MSDVLPTDTPEIVPSATPDAPPSLVARPAPAPPAAADATLPAVAPANPYDTPNPYDGDTQLGLQTTVKGAFGHTAVRSAAPALGGLALAGVGAELGAAIGAPAAPFTLGLSVPVGSLLGAFGAMYVGSASVAKVQDYLLSKAPDSWKEAIGQDDRQQKLEQAEHPYASFLGGMAPYAVAMRPGWGAAAKLPDTATSFERLMANPVTARLFGGAVMGGMELGQEKVSDPEVSWPKVAIATGFGMVFNKPTALGEKLANAGPSAAKYTLNLFNKPAEAPVVPAAESATAATGETAAPADTTPAKPKGFPVDLFHPEPTIAQAGDLKVMGPGITEEVHNGTARQDPHAEMAAQAAARAEQALLGEPNKPPVESIARRMEPELFDHYDALSAQRDALRQAIADHNNPPDHLVADAQGAVDEIQGRLDAHLQDQNGYSGGPEARRLRANLRAAQAHLDDLTTRRTAYAAGHGVETPEAAQARQHLLDTDIQLRDASREVAAAYRRAAEHTGAETIEPAPLPAPEMTADGLTVQEPAPVLPEEATQAAPRPAESLTAPVARPLAEQKAAIAADVAKRLVAVGRPADEAQAAGALIAARFATRAARFEGKLGTAEELYRREGAEIRGPDGRALPAMKPFAPEPTPKAGLDTPAGNVAPDPAIMPVESGTPPAEPVAAARSAQQVWDDFAAQRQARQSKRVANFGFNDRFDRNGKPLRAGKSQAWEPGNTVDVGFLKDLLVVRHNADGSFDLVSKPNASGQSKAYNVRPHEGISGGKPVDFRAATRDLVPGELAQAVTPILAEPPPVPVPAPDYPAVHEAVQTAADDGAIARDEAMFETPAAKPAPVKGKAKPKKPKPKAPARDLSVLEYLAHGGGLSADPELRAILDGNPFVPGAGRLIRKTGGMTLDDALQSLKDGGYLFDAADHARGAAALDTRAALDLIDRAARGEKIYPQGSDAALGVDRHADQFAAEQRAKKEIVAAHERIGVKDLDAGILGRASELLADGHETEPLAAFERATMEQARDDEAMRAAMEGDARDTAYTGFLTDGPHEEPVPFDFGEAGAVRDDRAAVGEGQPGEGGVLRAAGDAVREHGEDPVERALSPEAGRGESGSALPEWATEPFHGLTFDEWRDFHQSRTLAEIEADADKAGISHALSEKGGTITVSKIVVPEGARGQGLGTALMRQILDYADATGQKVALTPDGVFGGTVSRLKAFYKSLGFRDNKGKSRDFSTRETMIREPKGRDFNQISPDQARALPYPTRLPEDPNFARAVEATPGASLEPDGLRLTTVRWQKPEQSGDMSVRTGVFYLPEGSKAARHYKTSPGTNAAQSYGGSEKMAGETLLRAPLFVKGATGGKVPEAAYDMLKGKGAAAKLNKAVRDVAVGQSFLERKDPGLREEQVAKLLEEHGANPDDAWHILQNSEKGNQLTYALQENIIAHAVREAGYDSVLGYGVGRDPAKTPTLSEVFDVRETHYPDGSGEGVVHPNFEGAFAQSARGKIRIAAGRKPVISMLADANASTFIHESGHQFLEELIRDGEHPDAPAGVKDDAHTVRDWLGVTGNDDIKTRHHEKFARGFEQYLREGVAPSRELAGVFSRFRDWLVSIYQSIKSLGAPINDDIRGVFDRMLAEEPQRTVIAPARETAAHLADIHEADAAHTEPHEAEPAADRIVAETARAQDDLPPEIQNELDTAAQDLGLADPAEPAGQDGAGGGGSAALAPDRAPPGPVGAGGGGGAQRAALETGGAGAVPEGGGFSRDAKPDTGHPLAPRRAERLSEPEPDFVDKAGNIRLDNLTTSEDVAKAIREAAEANDDFIGERRGVVTDGQVMDLAEDLGMDLDMLNRRKIGEAFNAEQVVAARKLLVESATKVGDLMRKAAMGSDEDVMAYAAAKDRHQMIQAHVAGITAEAGRALRAFRNIAGQTDAAGVDQFIRQATGKTLFQLRQEAKLGAMLDTPQKVSKMMADARKRTFGRLLLEYWINGLISGPATHTTYMIGNTVSAVHKVFFETPGAALVGAVRAGLGREGSRVRLGETKARLKAGVTAVGPSLKAAGESFRSGMTTLLPGEVGRKLPFQPPGAQIQAPVLDEHYTARQAASAATFGLVRGLRDGFIAAGTLVKNGGVDGAPLFSVVDSHLGLIPDFAVRGVNVAPVGTLARAPGRFISAIHSFFRSTNYSMEKAALAYRQAADEGLSGRAFDARVAQLRQSPTPEITETAVHEATRLTLMGEGGQFMRNLSKFINTEVGGVAIGKFVDPFVHIAGQIMSQALMHRSPLGFLSAEIRADLLGRNGPAAADTAAGKMLVGTALAVTAMWLNHEGYLSGSGPSDKGEAATWRLAGNQPHSIRIGDTWYAANKLGPLGTLMSVAADFGEIIHKLGEEDAIEVGGHIMHAFMQNILDESFMRGPAELLQALEDSDRYGAAYVRNFLSSFVPYSVGMAQEARAMDPYVRQARTILDAVKAKIPGLSQTLMAKRDLWGEPMLTKDALIGKGITSIYETLQTRDPVNLAMLNLGINKAQVGRTIRGVDLTDDQHDDFVRLAGQMTKQRLDVIVGSPDFQRFPSHIQHDVIDQAFKQCREVARNMMMAKYPQIAADAAKAKMEKFQDD